MHGNLDPFKGLLLMGDIGVGKSTMLQIVRRFCKKYRPLDKERREYSFRIVRCDAVCQDYAKEGYGGIESCINSRRMAFDELGSETVPVSHYGSPLNVMQYILSARYDRRFESFTHATTNFTREDIIQVYGERAYDRCKEMFNFVEMRGESFRHE